MKGIILAGGAGTRLHPLTLVASKQLLPIYNKPMIYYSLSTLMLTGIRDILLISTPADISLFQRLLGNGAQWGISITYAVQPKPEGLPQAFLIASEFIADQPSCLVLGDNLFHGAGLSGILLDAIRQHDGATIFAYRVKDPERYGVVEFDATGHAISLEEKPEHPRSHFAMPGLYFFDATVCCRAADLRPSARGELEITDLTRSYLSEGRLRVHKLPRGVAWLDTGTHESLLHAANYIRTIEERQGLMVGSPEEVAFRLGHIDACRLHALADAMGKTAYACYLRDLTDE